MDVRVCVYSVFVLSCVQGVTLRRADPPSKESNRQCIRSRNWKSGQGPTNDRYIVIWSNFSQFHGNILLKQWNRKRCSALWCVSGWGRSKHTEYWCRNRLDGQETDGGLRLILWKYCVIVRGYWKNSWESFLIADCSVGSMGISNSV
jgi:hypothetical protein